MTTSQRGNAWEIWRRVLPVGLVLAAVVTAFVAMPFAIAANAALAVTEY
jgi:hypothetical protein